MATGESELVRTGFFSAPTSTNVGAEYKTKNAPTRSAYHGKQFLVNGQKWGKQTPDCFIDKEYKRLSEGEPYISIYQREKREFLEKKKTFVSEKPFKPTNPSKKSGNAGGLDGCIGEVHLSKEPLPFREKGKPGKGLRNFTIAPPRTKPAGYPLDLRTIGAPLEYMVEPYHPAREIEKGIRKKEREKIIKPWGACSKGGGLFDNSQYNALGGSGERRRPSTVPTKPFTPCGPVKKGNYAYGKLSEVCYKNWEGEPYVDGYKLFLKKPGQIGDKPFRPSGDKKSTYTPSINPYSVDAKPPLPEIVQ